MNEFEQLCEAVSTTLKQTKILRYPKQIQLSKEFSEALAKEISRHMQILDESQQPIRDLPEKFLKALKFELIEITEKKKKPTQMDLKPRQKWDINPRERIHGTGKGKGYNRAKEKESLKGED